MAHKFKAKRVKRSYQQRIVAPPEVVFPLLCPVREAEWLHGWQYELIYSNSGVAEEGCVFTSSSEGEKDTIWIITRRDEDKKEIEFARITPESRVAMLEIAVAPDGGHGSIVNITYTFTALTVAGNDLLDHFTEENFGKSMAFWEKSMNHFIRTGEKLVPTPE